MADDVADALARLGRRPIVVATHPRSGTHLTMDLIRWHFPDCESWKLPGENLNRLYVSLEAVFSPRARGRMSQRKALAVLRRVRRPIIKTHLGWDELWNGPTVSLADVSPPWRSWLRTWADFVYVHRDGRDVMCSWHLFSKGRPEARCPVGEFMRQEVGGASRVASWARHVRNWIEADGVHVVRFEDVKQDPRAVVGDLERALKMAPRHRDRVLPPRLKGLWHSRIHRLCGVRPRSSAILVHYPGERLERWQEAFTVEDRAFFDREAGDLLIELGYEASRDWVGAGDEATKRR